MKSLVLILCTLLVAVAGYTTALTCDENEVVDDCPVDCPYDYCPKSETYDRVICRRPSICPPPACKCGFFYRRADNGTCIETDKCPPFDCSSRPNEEFNPCPSYCPTDDCSMASRTGECPYWMLIVVQCTPQCRCIKDYWRKDGICVPYHECPQIENLMPALEESSKEPIIEVERRPQDNEATTEDH